MSIITKPDASMQRVAPDEIGEELEGWYSEAPKVGERFCFWWVAKNGEMCYKDTSKVVSLFGTADGYIINTLTGSVYVIREFLDG